MKLVRVPCELTFFGEEISEANLHRMLWLGHIPRGSTEVGLGSTFVVNVIMLTNERLDKCLGCHQTESGMSSPPDCGARKYPHSALGAADSRHALFCEHRGALLGCRRESQPWPGPHM